MDFAHDAFTTARRQRPRVSLSRPPTAIRLGTAWPSTLDETRHGKTTFVIHRSFEASPSQLFDAWIEPAQLVKWLPPAGFTMTVQSADVRVGGLSLFKMSNGQDTFYVQYAYRKIDRPDRLEFVQRFCDEQGQRWPSSSASGFSRCATRDAATGTPRTRPIHVQLWFANHSETSTRMRR